MIYAVPNRRFAALKAEGLLVIIQDEVRTENVAALLARVANGELVEAKAAGRFSKGNRDRCYLCGDEVTPFHWKEMGVIYFRHLNNRDCIGDSANPRAVHQSDT